jgi:hypothetical protein
MTASLAVRDLAQDLLAQLWQPSCPSPDLVSLAASLLPGVREQAGPASAETEGPRWEIVIAPGAIQVRTRDWARSSRYQEREAQRQTKQVDQLIGWLTDQGEFPADREPSREITGWSRQSRANMVKTLCQLDYTPLFTDPTRLPAMLTLTYPGDWVTVAPHGKAVKSHLKILRKRYRRAWGQDLACVWKLEFQRRGAPHIHLLMVPPDGVAERHSFRQWISKAWADVVNHPDPAEYARNVLAGTGLDWAPGLRSTDPKRVAVYFTKHGAFAAKEYQHCVPKAWQEKGRGPGRFWGYWALRPARAGVRVLPEVGVTVGRLLRRWARAQGTTRQTTRMRVEQATGRIRYRNSRVRVRRLVGCRGWVSVNDGAAFASQIARYLAGLP